MKDIQQHIISDSASILDALSKINGITNPVSLVLFVVDDKNRMIGTLTDGDIRRKLVDGLTLDALIKDVMYREFRFVLQGHVDVSEIRAYKDKGITLLPLLDDQRHIIDIYDFKHKQSILPVDAVLMAGGKGERLRPLTEKIPKPLLQVGDRAIIDHNVDRLISYGIENISVTVNYLKEQIEEHYKEPRSGIQVKCCREPRYLGTLGSVKFVEKFYNNAVLVMNSDLFTNIDYEDFYLHFREHDADMSVAAIPYSVSIPYGICDLEGREIKGVQEKPTYNFYANAGIYLLKRSMLDIIPDDTFFNATDMIELLVGQGKKVIRFPLNGTWIDIGNPQEYQKAKELVKYLR